MTLPAGWPPNHDPEVPLRKSLPPGDWQQVVRTICSRHRLPTGSLAPFPSGSDVVFGGDGFVVKLSRPRWRAEIEAEARILRHLEGRIPFGTACVLAEGEIDAWPYVVQSRLPGRSLGSVWADITPAERHSLADGLGRTAAELHAVGGYPDDGSWPGFLEERRRDVVEHHRKLGLPEAWLERLEPFLESVPLAESSPVLLHTELLDEHVLVEERGGQWKITGLLDFADSRVGDPHYEFAAPIEFLFRGEAGLLPSFLRAYGWTDTELTHEGGRRLAAWGLLHLFGSLPRVLAVAGTPEPRDFDELVERVYRLEP